MPAQGPQLPQFQTSDTTLTQLQNRWAAFLNPLLASPLAAPALLQRVTLQTGANSVNHGLGTAPQGWLVVRWHGSWSEVYDTQDTNPLKALTLQLHASAPVIVDLLIF